MSKQYFIYEDKRYKEKKQSFCSGCAFDVPNYENCAKVNEIRKCMAEKRDDKIGVIFVEVKK